MSSIRHQINIHASPRAVWRMLTTEAGLLEWWADAARIDARDGGRIVVETEGDEGMIEERGLFHELRPTRRIEIHWDSNSPAETKGTRLQFQIARDGGETRVALIHSGGGILEDEEARERLDKDWKAALKALRGALEND